MKCTDQVQNSQDIISNPGIDASEVHRVPAAVFLGIVPGQEEVSHLSGLSRVTGGGVEQSP